jgi:transcriptional regulator with XRE-family HTH domain
MVYSVKAPDVANSLGEHIRKKRIEKGQFQKQVAEILGVSEDTVTYWEKNRCEPQVKHYPKIISYLGYYPFTHETETLAGKLMQIRFCYGWSFRQCANVLCISEDAAKRWERGKPVNMPEMRTFIEKVWHGSKTNTLF